jgi:hypothetical protein
MVVEKVALGQVFSEFFGFPCQSSFHQILHPHNQPRQVQYANWWPKCRVNPVGLHPPQFEFKKKHVFSFLKNNLRNVAQGRGKGKYQ